MNPSVSVNWVPGMTLEEMEKQCILKAFQWCRNNKTQCAGMLGIAIRTLENKLEKYQKDGGDYDEQKLARQKVREYELGRARGKLITEYNGVGSGYQISKNLPPPVESTATVLSNGVETQGGPRMEPTTNPSAKQSVPLLKQEEIQSVLPKNAPQNSGRKNR